ncbi:GAF domain-containing protein [Pseudenhygromyxa sp. WMMC2535]|uniref:GAF domain-containing protein n=1 Tax=Pseudenhygromyxa sp. WMMC2535 TaxID=2712867 RepID=UPI0015521E4F|nr:GAF domain-containing protein [Pseudenhygromyxa sp. WMMC2535]NVB40778.1 GAF domain-containing protein [Pseudenhygromyxa sp. WMMC2535]
MPAAPLPANEAQRLAVLREYEILDSEFDSRFDDLAQLAAHLCKVPIVAISLVDEARQWFKAAIGLEVRETPREQAFCAHAILGEEVFVVPDACEDPRFLDNPLVTENPGIRFYAGAPLQVREGFRLGTLCAIDTQPRELDAEQLDALRRLARAVVSMMELRRLNTGLADALANIRTLGELIPICSHCRKVRDDRNYWDHLERFVSTKTGSRFTHGICPDCVREQFPEVADAVLSQLPNG